MMAARPSGQRLRGASLAILAALSLPGLLLADAVAPEASATRGKRIYVEGVSERGGDITAIVGDESVSLPASAVPCASCHGKDGLGRPEGGVLPPDIRWSELVKNYGHVHEDGRRHPAFDDASIARSIAAGIDPAGNRLDTSMPLYRMSAQDMADLVAYLQELEADHDPGVESARVQVGSLLPFNGPQAALGKAMAQVMHAYFQDVNAAGGIFGRQIDLLSVPLGTSAEASVENLAAAYRAEGLFALVGAYSVGMDDELLAFTREHALPLVAPFTLDPGDAFTDAGAFYLYAGFADQARVLADRALAQAGSGAGVLLVGPNTPRVDRVLQAVRDRFRLRGAVAPQELRYPAAAFSLPELVKRREELSAEAILFFGSQPELESSLKELARRGQHPHVYLLSSLLSRPLFSAPKDFDRRLLIAYPTLVSDVSDKGRLEYQDLSTRHALPRDHIEAQIAALAAAKLFVEGLRGVGRHLSRAALVDSMEALYAYETGVTPPLSYGPNRRIGALGAHLLTVDLVNQGYAPVDGSWQELQ